MYLAIDIEGSYENKNVCLPWKPNSYLSTIAIYTNEGESKCWTFRHKEADNVPDREKVAEIQGYIDRANKIIGHNLSFDLLWLRHVGLVLDNSFVWDTGIVEYLLTGQTVFFPSLDSLAEKYLGDKKEDIVKTEYWEKGINTEYVPLDILSSYNIKDCELTLRIAEKQAPQVLKLNLTKLVKVYSDLAKPVTDIQYHGLGLDTNIREKLEEEYGTKIKRCDDKLAELFGRTINFNSPEQVSAALFGGYFTVPARCWYVRTNAKGTQSLGTRRDKYRKRLSGLGIKPNGTPGANGAYSTDKNHLIEIRKTLTDPVHKEVIDLLLEKSALSQMQDTYIVAVSNKHYNNVVHGNFQQTATATGRFSCSNPNLMNIPRDKTAPVKSMFVPRLGAFVEGDASQLEWRVAAFLSQCPVMIEEIEQGIDRHEKVRQEVFGGKVDRVIAKVYTFRQIYGGSPYSYYMDPKMPDFSLRRWEEINKAFFEKYHGLATWHDKLMKEVYKNGGIITNPTGRYFKFKRFPTRSGLEYRRPQVVNYPVQSFATADIIPLAMVELRKRLSYLGPKAVMCNQVHDSIMYDCVPEVVDEVAKHMLETFSSLPQLIKNAYGIDFNVRLDGEVKYSLSNWQDMKDWEK